MRDEYYTPEDVAARLVSGVESRQATVCLDTSCGSGRLLLAAERRWPAASYVGMDINARVVARLARSRPKWSLSPADALSSEAFELVANRTEESACTIAVLNPPFSMSSPRGIDFAMDGLRGRASPAMAHLVSTVAAASPEFVAAIAPESLLHSQLDVEWRLWLRERYQLSVGFCLPSDSFGGASINAVAVYLRRMTSALKPRIRVEPIRMPCVEIVRGGLPVFAASKANVGGVPFIHSTELGVLAAGFNVCRLKRVEPIERGVVSGWTILLPRVGLPKREFLVPVFVPGQAQLSDCVIGLCFGGKRDAVLGCRSLLLEFDRLISAYKGTGARFVTMERLSRLVCSLEVAE